MTKDTKALALEAFGRLTAGMQLDKQQVIDHEIVANALRTALATPAEPVRCDNAKTDEPCEPCIMCNAKGHFGGKFPATK